MSFVISKVPPVPQDDTNSMAANAARHHPGALIMQVKTFIAAAATAFAAFAAFAQEATVEPTTKLVSAITRADVHAARICERVGSA
jgi:hypothetical protein